MTGNQLSHVDQNGQVTMVDTSAKPAVHRRAVAEGYFIASESTLDLLMNDGLPKGDAMATARIAGIQAAKDCDRLIPLCHGLPLDQVTVEFDRVDATRVRIECSATVVARTGVEMEALTAVSLAALTLYDMTKAVDRELRIEGIRLVSKVKGEA
ncbi:MAG: cyclic pyranopterin monophosphate synthase MoaC [Phycisphaerales bacterium]|nr:cyclic pyranopterin monophosphate synthase MoaC [Phycisphaerales bacterium]